KLRDARKRSIKSRLAGERSASDTTTGTLRMSVVAAYPSITSWRIGATTTTPKSRGSWRSSMSSFQIRKKTRRMSHPLPSQPDRRQRQRRRREKRQRDELRPEHGNPGALQNDRAQGNQEISRRHRVGDRPQERRHAGNRKNESGQQHRRKEGHESRELEG